MSVAAVMLVGSALVFLPPRYKATTVVLVDPRQPRVTNTEAGISGTGAGLWEVLKGKTSFLNGLGNAKVVKAS